MRHRRLAGAVTALIVLAVGTGIGSASIGVTSTASSVTVTKDINRTDLDASGKETVLDSRHVSLTVGTTTNLAPDQRISVSWTGARPTAGYSAQANDVNFAPSAEYPMVLLECHGSDTEPGGIKPEDCFTASNIDRLTDAGDGQTTGAVWQDDRYAPDSLRGTNQWPQPFPTADDCPNPSSGVPTPPTPNDAAYYLPFVSASGKTYSACTVYAMPPEAGNTSFTGNVLPNEQFAATKLDGTGSAGFQVRNGVQNLSLGCSDTQSCSIVAVPVLGLSCDGSDATRAKTGLGKVTFTKLHQNCIGTQQFTDGKQLGGQFHCGPANRSLEGCLWYAPSNWRNHLSVPLHFADAGAACAVVGGHPQAVINLYGSEIFNTAAVQWSPAFCQNASSDFHFSAVAQGEPPARAGVTSTDPAALTSFGTGSDADVSTTTAPIAATGFGVGYVLDTRDSAGAYAGQYANLRLTPRLLAKLMTESYNAFASDHGAGTSTVTTTVGTTTTTTTVTTKADVVGSNPSSMLADPEFQALNPNAPQNDNSSASAALLMLNSQSDLMYALTSYIDADPEAKAWLDGAPDPWGMRVNPAFQGVDTPTALWTLYDQWNKPASEWGGNADPNACPQLAESPYLSLVAAPVSRIVQTTQALNDQRPNNQTACNDIGNNQSAPGRAPLLQTGTRVVFALTSLADAAKYQLNMASLQTTVKAATPPTSAADYTASLDGRSFVNASDMSVQTAADHMTASSDGYWSLPYDQVHSNPELTGAYPLTLPIQLTTATTGVDPARAKDLAALYQFAAGAGQVAGPNAGQLPDGYLPVTAANGLGAWVKQLQQAAVTVAAQQGGASPSATATPSASAVASSSPKATKKATTTPAKGAASGGTTPTSAAATTTDTGAVVPTPSASTSSSAAPAASSPAVAAPSTPDTELASNSKTAGAGGALDGAALPVLLGIVLLGILAVLAQMWRRQMLRTKP